MPDIFQDSSQYFHISAFYALSLPYYHMEHHTHSSYEIMYITSGSCRVFCLDGTQDTEFPLKSGQFIFIRPDVPHRLEIPDGFPCSILNLEFSLTSEKSPVALDFEGTDIDSYGIVFIDGLHERVCNLVCCLC